MIGKYTPVKHLPAGHQHHNAFTGVGNAWAMLDTVCWRNKLGVQIWEITEIRAKSISSVSKEVQA